MNDRLGSRMIPVSMRGALLLLVLMALLPLVIVEAGIYAVWYRSRWSEEAKVTLETARETARTFEAYVQDVRRHESAIGEALNGLHPYTAEQANRYMAKAGQGDSTVRSWSWSDPEGKIIASSDPRAVGLNIGDRAYFQELRGGRPWTVSNLLTDRVNGGPIFTIANRTDDQKGSLVGVVIAVVEVRNLGERAVELYHPVGEAIALFDRDGVLVYSSQKSLDIFQDRRGDDLLLAEALKSGAQQSGVVTRAAHDGKASEKHIAARIPIQGVGWVAGARRPVAQAMADVYSSLLIAGGATLLVALGSSALALTTSGSIIRQLRRLQSHAEAVGRGEFEHVVDRTRVRELVQLADAFNRAGAAVHEAQEGLEATNAALEQRVRQRTSELAATIVRLERTDRELRAASLYARGLLEASLDPLVTISPEGKITDVNEATEAATGVPRRQLVGSDFSDYFTEPDKAREGYRKVLSEGLVQDYPLTIRHASGRTIDVLYNAVVYRNEAGTVQGVFAAARDVTERNRIASELDQHRTHLEELVEQRTEQLATTNRQLKSEIAEHKQTAERLMQSNQELEQFAYVASHDLQEPLRVVVGYVQLLERRYKDRLDADADQFIHYITDGVARMQQLIADLLNYSRIGTRGKAFHATDMRKVLDRALANLQPVVEESGAKIACDGLPSVQGDEIQLVQLFQNLISNGIKFHGERPAEIDISARRDGDRWLFAVRDNGIGIERQYWEQIFVIFRRLHTRHKYAGTGIGLAVCKRIVERHDGQIWLDSQPGQGTTFYFTLP